MTTLTPPIEWRERPVQFGRTQSLMGIITQPRTVTGPPVVLLGAGIIHRIGPSRASVELARALASRGHTVLRFDLSGIGDSPRAEEARLTDAAIADMRDAITLMAETAENPWGDRVAAVGFCSGADNGFFLAADEPRIGALVLFDPTIHRTPGFHRRELWRHLTSPRAWWNLLSGHSIRARLRRPDNSLAAQPPAYYGLLVANPEDARRRATVLRERGVHANVLLSSVARNYCNAPQQVAESLGEGFTVTWAPHVDHVLSQRSHVEWLCQTVPAWLASVAPNTPGGTTP